MAKRPRVDAFLIGEKLTGEKLAAATREEPTDKRAARALREESADHIRLRKLLAKKLRLIKEDFSNADLDSADLGDANLRGVNFSGANLGGANLVDADLSGANLSNADLSGARLRGANLHETNFSHADLRYTDLLGANLNGANFSGANIYRNLGLPSGISTSTLEASQHGANSEESEALIKQAASEGFGADPEALGLEEVTDDVSELVGEDGADGVPEGENPANVESGPEDAAAGGAESDDEEKADEATDMSTLDQDLVDQKIANAELRIGQDITAIRGTQERIVETLDRLGDRLEHLDGRFDKAEERDASTRKHAWGVAIATVAAVAAVVAISVGQVGDRVSDSASANRALIEKSEAWTRDSIEQERQARRDFEATVVEALKAAKP